MNEMEEVRRRFSDEDSAHRWSDMYVSETENLEEHNYRRRRDRAVGFLLPSLPPQGKVLDLGCGAGPMLYELRRLGIDCTGADYSTDMLRYAEERLRAAGLDASRLVQTDFRNTPFPDASFDAVLCLGVISYVEDYEPALQEIKRILKPGGTLIISWRSSFNPVMSDPVEMLRRLKSKLLGEDTSKPFLPGRFLDYRLVTRQIERLGFEYVDFVGIGFGPFRIAGRKLFSERRGIQVSDALTRLFDVLRARWLFKRMTDVSLWVYTRAESW